MKKCKAIRIPLPIQHELAEWHVQSPLPSEWSNQQMLRNARGQAEDELAHGHTGLGRDRPEGQAPCTATVASSFSSTPSRTSNAHLPGAPVIDATLHDVKHVAYYLKQRQYYMGRAGGAQMGPIPMVPPPTIPYTIPRLLPIFVPPQHISRTRSSSPIRGRPVDSH